MDSRPFVQAVQQLKGAYIKLLDSISALCELSAIRVQGQAESELLESALRVLMQNQDLERCSVYMLEDGWLVNRAGLDWDDLIGLEPRQTRVPRRFAIGEGVIGRAAASGGLYHCRDCRSDEHFLGTEGAVKDTGGPFGSLISVPIRNQDELFGVLNVSHPHANFFNESHERTLTVFGNFLAQMLINNRLVHQMDRLVQQRTSQLEESLATAEELRRRYEELSVMDELTELHNRRFFFSEARAALSRSLRRAGPFAVLLIDVDHFKRVNDRFGHCAGDRVLREVGAVIMGQVREGDILARFGGEEFAVALPDTDFSGAAVLAERICAAVRGCDWAEGDKRFDVTLSIGISHCDCRSPEQSQLLLDRLLQEADQALYFGKQNGRDQVRAFCDIACQL